MSASSKKKLRTEQGSAKLTEKQLEAKKEENKIKLYTTLFVVVLVCLIAVAIFAGVNNKIKSSGTRERSTVAATVGSHQLSNAELGYYFIDTVNNFYSNNGSYASMFGLDVTKALDKQVMDEESGTTWADYFLDSALESARATYAMVDAANADSFTLSAEQEEQVANLADSVSSYALLYGYSDGDAYMKAIYGNGASVKGFQDYYRNNILADAYRTHYSDSLTYTDQQIRDYEQDKYNNFSSYTYNQYYLASTKYLTGGTTDADGNVNYSAEERAAAAKAAEAEIQSVVADSITSVEAFDQAVAALSVNANSEAKSTAYNNQLYTSVNSRIVDWLSDASRKEGDKTVIANTSVTTAEDGSEVTEINGYYAVYFISSNDNKFPLPNVRHILVSFEGGTANAGGSTVYSDEEKAAAKSAAEAILAEWKSGEATEASFAALATEKTTDPGSQANGGLYEDIKPGQMVANFNDWCFDASRQPGDIGIVETEYGYHVMYFVGFSAMTYRDSMIKSEMQNADFNAWYTAKIEAVQASLVDTKYIRKDIILNKEG